MEETEGMSDGMNEERAAAPEEEPKAGEGAVKGEEDAPRALREGCGSGGCEDRESQAEEDRVRRSRGAGGGDIP